MPLEFSCTPYRDDNIHYIVILKQDINSPMAIKLYREDGEKLVLSIPDEYVIEFLGKVNTLLSPEILPENNDKKGGCFISSLI